MPRGFVCQQCIARDFALIGEYQIWDYGTLNRLRNSVQIQDCRLCLLIADALSSSLSEWLSAELLSVQSPRGLSLYPVLDQVAEVLDKGDYHIKLRALKLGKGNPDFNRRKRLAIYMMIPDVSEKFSSMMSGLGPTTSRMVSTFKVARMYVKFRGRFLCGEFFQAHSDLFENRDGHTTALNIPYTHSGDAGVHQMVKGWLNTCTTSHGKLCNDRGKGAADLPKRYLEVHHPHGSDFIRLREANDYMAPQQGHYVALSYTWGKEPFTTTTPQNFQAHKAGIRLSDLPQSIQDAVEVTRQLEIPYLWVDSLCILQGRSLEARRDLAEQCPLMGRIYGQAFLTIIAANTRGAHEPILRERNQAEHQWVMLDRSFYPEDCHLDWHKPGAMVLPGHSVRRGDWQSFSDTRGWCLQEKMLSKRILAYYETCAVFTCRTTWWTEIEPVRESGFRDSDSLRGSSSEAKYKKHFWAGVMMSTHGRWIHDAIDDVWACLVWTHLVHTYSKRDLTNGSDRLAAVAGMAEVIQRLFGYEYSAGIFDEVPEWHLMWAHGGKTVNGQRTYPVATSYRAPSWSWASVDGRVDFHFDDTHSAQEASSGRLPNPLISLSGSIGEAVTQSSDNKKLNYKMDWDTGATVCDYEHVLESTKVTDLGLTVMGYVRVTGDLYATYGVFEPWFQPEQGKHPHDHWSGSFFDRGPDAPRPDTLYYLEIYSYAFTFPRKSRPEKMSSGLILEALPPDTQPGSALSMAGMTPPQDGCITGSNRVFNIRPQHAHLPRFRRVGCFWAVPHLRDRVDTDYVNLLIL